MNRLEQFLSVIVSGMRLIETGLRQKLKKKENFKG